MKTPDQVNELIEGKEYELEQQLRAIGKMQIELSEATIVAKQLEAEIWILKDVMERGD